MNEPSRKRRTWACLGCVAAAVLTPCLLCYAIYVYFNPYNEVVIRISRLPEDTHYLCLVADRPRGPEVMWLSRAKVFPTRIRPLDDGSDEFRFFTDRTRFEDAVRWVSSVRVGVLRRTKERKWFVHWFGPPKSKVNGRSLLLGQGKWEVDLRDADEVQPVSDDQIRAMRITDPPAKE